MKAIIFSDTHLHIWKDHNSGFKRTRMQMQVIENLFSIASRYKVPLIFTGDMFHDPSGISNPLWSLFQPWITELFNLYPVELYAISGNHDEAEINNFRRRSPSYIHTLSQSLKNFHCIDFYQKEFEDWVIHGVPYITFNEGLMEVVKDIKKVPGKKNILLLHTDFKGQKDVNGMVVGKGEGVEEEYLSTFDLVLSGHIHKKGRIRGNMYSIGSPYQTRLSDMGGEFGYWILKDDFKPIFKPLKDLPEFKFYKEESETDDFHYWIKQPLEAKDLVKKSIDIDLSNKGKLVKSYLDYLGIKSKMKRSYLMYLVREVTE